MAAAGTFKLNKRTIADIAKHDAGLKAKIDGVGNKIQHETKGKAHVDHYTTDRYVAGVVCRRIDQAKHGILTRAVGILGGRMSPHHPGRHGRGAAGSGGGSP